MRTMKVTVLSLNSLLQARRRSRIFGNIDTTLVEMNESEVVHAIMKSVFTTDRIQSLFERDDMFFDALKRRSGHSKKI